ncbi:MAG: glycosyltransferase family 4 protein, partial [Gemmatimonadaceae bacterium]|nr:glycosyltransferase family 4 protein [Chitinophagaceae bacterium]
LVPVPHSNDGFRIALIGRLETFHKGYDLLIDVIAKQKWKDRNLHFSIYGTGPHQLLLERMSAEQGITNLHFMGHTDSIEEVWKTHHLLLMPSRIEGQSLTLIEAMRYNRSAIVTNVGGAGELIEEGVCGFIAEYPSASAIDSAMERAWESRLEWESFGIRAGEAIGRKHPKNAMADFIEKITKLTAADRNTDKVILP